MLKKQLAHRKRLARKARAKWGRIPIGWVGGVLLFLDNREPVPNVEAVPKPQPATPEPPMRREEPPPRSRETWRPFYDRGFNMRMY